MRSTCAVEDDICSLQCAIGLKSDLTNASRSPAQEEKGKEDEEEDDDISPKEHVLTRKRCP